MPRALHIKEKTIFDTVVFKFIFKVFYRAFYKLKGWKSTGYVPVGPGITLAAPHTSSWDFIYALGEAILHDVKIYFSINKSWCVAPIIGPFILWLGGIPIDRSAKEQGQVALIKDFIERHKDQRICFLFSPEGTRSKVKQWRTGFYYVAKETQLPIFLAKVDYKKKELGIFHRFVLTDDKDDDIHTLQAAYQLVCSKYPALQFPEYARSEPEITAQEAIILKLIYQSPEPLLLTQCAQLAQDAMTLADFDRLQEKGLLTPVDSNGETRYNTTYLAQGCLLHRFHCLAKA